MTLRLRMNKERHSCEAKLRNVQIWQMRGAVFKVQRVCLLQALQVKQLSW